MFRPSLDRMEEDVEELKDVEERLLRARDKGADSLVAESNTLAEADQAVAAVVEWPRAVSAALDGLDETLPAPVVTDHQLVPQSVQEQVRRLESDIERVVTELRSSVNQTVVGLQEPSGSMGGEPSDRAKSSSGCARRGGYRQAPQELNALQRRKAELTGLVQGRPDAVKRKEVLGGQRTGLLDSLGEARRQKSRATEDAARDLTDRVGDRVRVRTIRSQTVLSCSGCSKSSSRDGVRGRRNWRNLSRLGHLSSQRRCAVVLARSRPSGALGRPPRRSLSFHRRPCGPARSATSRTK